MKEIRVHGRGGMGNVTAAELLAEAAFHDGKYAQAFPSFGAEREGAPVLAFVRISDQPIRLRQQAYEPGYLIVKDHSLLCAESMLEEYLQPQKRFAHLFQGGDQIKAIQAIADDNAEKYGIVRMWESDV